MDVPRAVRQLRDRLGKISQARLAEMIGSDVSVITISRWERGELMPYPKNRQRLADIALSHQWVDIAAALVDVPFEEWMEVFQANLPLRYRDWIVLTMCSADGDLFSPEDPDSPTDAELEVVRKYEEMMQAANELLNHLADLRNAGTSFIVPPPNEHFRALWFDRLEERRKHHGQEAKSKG
ncbi:MAG: helix-turn-helix transcriptional regulator [Bryobacterales bacterium]|nr:helix-turn-helix transcriptional regulator [Bryobacterales bacterium]